MRQTLPVAFGCMRDESGNTPSQAIELILQILEYNDNEGNEFDDAEWIAAWIYGLEKVKIFVLFRFKGNRSQRNRKRNGILLLKSFIDVSNAKA